MVNKPTYKEIERQVTEIKHAEEVLERERSLLKSVMEATDVMLVYLDIDFNFVWVNDAYAATCNSRPEEMVGKNHFALYPNAENEAIFRRVRDSGQPAFCKDKPFEFPDQPERGVTYWDWSLVPVKDAAGRVQGLVFSLRETTKYKQAVEALRQNEIIFRTYFENVAFGAAQIDAHGRFIRINDRYCQITGYSRKELLGGMTPMDLDVPGGREATRLMLERFLSGKERLYTTEKRYVRKDGRVIWVLVAAAAVRNEEGRLLYSAGIVQDITQRKRAEEALRDSEQRYRRLFEDDLTGDFVATGDGEILLCNPAFVHLYGFAGEQEAVGASFPALKANPGDWQRLLELLKREGRAQKREVDHRRRDGRIIHVVENVIAFFDADGKLSRIQGYVFDDTERKRAEEALLQAKAELERKVQQRTAQLAHQATQLRALAGELTLSEHRERRRMAKVLHDHLQQLLVSAKFRTTIIGRSMDEVIREAAGEVEAILDDALDVSRNLTAELSPPILHEGGLVPGLEWLARWMLKKHGLVVDLATEPHLPDIADDVRVLLFESVRELLLNAIKHARVRSAGVSVRPIESGQVQVMVSDAGPGFDPARVKQAGSGKGGFGLFSIRERLDLIGGRMEIDSAPGQGSRFTLIVPVRQPEAVAPGETVPAIKAVVQETAVVSQPKAGKVIRVLLADDHAVMRQGLAQLLGQESDIEVVGQAADGQDAVELTRKLLPDVILMDIAMPRLNGVEATRAVSTEYPGICIIGLSMFEEAEGAQTLRDAGATAYLTKSGPSEELITTIRKCVARKVNP